MMNKFRVYFNYEEIQIYKWIWNYKNFEFIFEWLLGIDSLGKNCFELCSCQVKKSITLTDLLFNIDMSLKAIQGQICRKASGVFICSEVVLNMSSVLGCQPYVTAIL